MGIKTCGNVIQKVIVQEWGGKRKSFTRGEKEVSTFFETEHGMEIVSESGYQLIPWHRVWEVQGVIQ